MEKLATIFSPSLSSEEGLIKSKGFNVDFTFIDKFITFGIFCFSIFFLCVCVCVVTCIIFHRSMPSFIIFHPHHQHFSVLVSCSGTRDSTGSVLITGGHNKDIRIKLLPPMCRFVTAYYQLVKSTYATTLPSPLKFWGRKIDR